MHNVTADQIEKNKQLIALVKQFPTIYNHDPTQQTGESVEEIWQKIGQQIGEPADACKKKWRLLRSSLIRYIKVFKDKSTSKGNRYRPYYLLEHMDFLLPFIDDKMIIRKVKPVVKTQSVQPAAATTTTVTLVKKDRDDDTILYAANTTPNTITYNVVATTSKDSSSQDLKPETQQTQDIQQYYNAGVKIIGEDYITTYQPGEQLIYQATSATAEEQQIQEQHEQQQQQECLQQECLQQESKAQSLQGTTIIPIPNMNSVFSSSNPSEASDLYFLIGLLPDFKNLNHDQKRKVKIGILKLIDDAVST